ncbi:MULTISPECIES: M14 family metallopeptidase [Croceitalea]|uniref:M14 family metallopeptidase n=1 Tax=Croceitalea vernalis TaxID=3075599 RepID=A0ABU3BGJ8_9FLAO|nr:MULTISPECIES: M14 family metallopeptidase [unclassified Croceitalea]MDT0539513.1 M14 family metallopeptidase [Croceitalea sp. P059]MDT0621305.1 M14 family metallopeptidase [Croceitalea sp. P007]
MKLFFSYLFFFTILLTACKSTEKPVATEIKKETGYQGQPKSPVVPTVDKPVQKQWKGNWAFNDSTTFFTNDFEGARLNGVAYDGNDHYTIWITAENTPINVSPWYAFKVWTKKPREITVKLAYQDSRSRYFPKISADGIHFKAIDSTAFKGINMGESDFGIKAAPEFAEITVAIGENPIWISAQELYTSTTVKSWIDSLAAKPFISTYEIGKSKENRPMQLLEINENKKSKKALMIISRQHPPEVTGFLAMKSFIETISSNSEQAKNFRKVHTVFVVPLMNPDGVDNGHWRHNMGGIDLNRDWQNFNQPETKSVRDFLKEKDEEGYEFVFGADFHSTWDDIYYPLDTAATGAKGKIIFDWIESISKRLPQKATNVRPSKTLSPTMVSRTYFFVNHGMPAIVFELGDNTPRPFLKEKGKVAAEELMRLLNSN